MSKLNKEARDYLIKQSCRLEIGTFVLDAPNLKSMAMFIMEILNPELVKHHGRIEKTKSPEGGGTQTVTEHYRRGKDYQ